jgi:hypothetical protein
VESIFKVEFELTDDEIDDFSTEVKSSLNGTLPIQLSLGKGDPSFKVVKRGPGGAALSRKADAIGQFVSKRINIDYIPSVRRADEAEAIVSNIVEWSAPLQLESFHRDLRGVRSAILVC